MLMRCSEKQAGLHHQERKVKIENNAYQELAYMLQCFHADSSAVPHAEGMLLDSL